ncbi:MAG: 23S rRNA (adenine(2503)-C(2))-methyltransferase RlmN [Spirochaetaceae bacterium]|jgi:23S rRNA (adenine2503-C2)-methyltransferase|nr:23S rRNA (adenine(2503)-C(2))-methyltransferase RlmN [Spirochaetaceae bacterium]
MNILAMDPKALCDHLYKNYSKGEFHSKGLFQHLHKTGSLEGLENHNHFIKNKSLANHLLQDFPLKLPDINTKHSISGSCKFTLMLEDQQYIEAVIIPMHGHNTLCVSSQVGCARNCIFCRTGTMGLIRNLTVQEIIAQYWTARFILSTDIQNIVFMGMGEPLDNLDNVLKAVDILTHPWGVALEKRRISLSTCGQGSGLLQLKKRIEEMPQCRYELMPLALSLHSSNNQVRDKLMPINHQWPLEKLKEILINLPHGQKKDKLYIEYLVIPGLNDSQKDAIGLRDFLSDVKVKINLIAYNPLPEQNLNHAEQIDVTRFWKKLRELGLSCYCRKSKGEDIFAACGQLVTSKHQAEP